MMFGKDVMDDGGTTTSRKSDRNDDLAGRGEEGEREREREYGAEPRMS